MRPATYHKPDLSKRCELCKNADRLNHRTYCTLGTPSIMSQLLAASDRQKVVESLKDNEVDPMGVCDHFDAYKE